MLNPNCSEAIWRIRLDNLTEDEKDQLRDLLFRLQEIGEAGENCVSEGPVHESNGKVDINRKLGSENIRSVPQEEVADIQKHWYDTGCWEETIFGIPVMVIKGDVPFNSCEWLENKLKELPFYNKLKIEGGDS